MPCFFVLGFKSRFQNLGPRDKTANFVWFDRALPFTNLMTKFCRIPMKYFSEIVSKGCLRRISFYFNHKSQYLINVTLVNIENFRFFHFFPCIFCSTNCSNSLSLFASEVFFQFCLSGASPGNILII